MMEINIHLFPHYEDQYKNISVPISFPFVPRTGENVILSKEQKEELLKKIENDSKESTPKIISICDIDRYIVVDEVYYHGNDGSIHIILSNS